MARVTPSTTPNPNAMKFTLDVTLAERIDTTRGEGTDSPFAAAMLDVDGVASVFGVNDFVTITREPDAEWDPIVCAVEDAAAAHLDAGGPAAAGDEVAEARKLLRNAVAPPKPRPVELGGRREGPEST
jgi:hypothetical protein